MYKLLVLIFCYFACPIFGQAQDLYLHTDRDQYQSADTLWFKVYGFDAQTLAAAPDQTVYVQLVSEDKKVICLRTLLLINGSAHNCISLDSLQGEYQLIAYSKALLGQKDLLFRKNILVSENKSQPVYSQVDSTKLDLQFLPEGGHLVAGLPAIVAFKATDANGSVDLEGVILNETKEEITRFKTIFKGMGWLSFVPKNNQKYKAKVVLGGKTYFFDLPKIEEYGVVMRVVHQESDSAATVRIYQNGYSFRSLKLEVMSRGRLCVAQNLAPKNLSIVKILKNALPTGIVQLRILADTSVLLERLMCVNRSQGIDFKLTSNTANIKPNEKVELTIMASQYGIPIQAEVSLSITDASQTNGTDSKNSLFSQLYLQSEVRGYVSEPAYYFDTAKAESYQHLDLLLLTQGWRKYRWNAQMPQIMLETAPPIEGLVTKYGSNKPSDGVTLTYSYSNQIDQIRTDARGYFKIENHHIQQDDRVYFQARKKHQDLFNIVLIGQKTENLYQKLPVLNAALQPKAQHKNNMVQTLDFVEKQTNGKALQLEEVVISGKSTQRKAVQQMITEIGLDMNTNLNLVMQDPYEVLNDLPEIKSLSQLILRKITGIHITHQFISLYGGDPEPVRYLAALGSNPLGVTPVAIYLNKTQQCTMCLDRQIEPIAAPSEIHKLIFLKAAASYTPSVILITKNTIPNYDYSKDKTVGSIVKNGLGFSPNKEFYAPKYENPKADKSTDKRATLYWNATVKTNQEGKATVTFYNSDVAKRLKIVLEGTDRRGNVGSSSLVVE